MTRPLYVGRVSRGERQQDPESQLAPLRASGARLGWGRGKEIALKTSAWDAKKAAEARRRILEPVKAGEVDVVAVWSLDRVSRGGVVDALGFIELLERHYGVQFYSLQEPQLSTATADPQTRELLVSIIAWAAKWESERKSQRLRAKAETKRNRAAAGGGRARWGRGRLATPAEIAQTWELRDAGATVRAIAEAVGISKSQVGRILAAPRPVPAQAAGQGPAPEGETGASEREDWDKDGEAE